MRPWRQAGTADAAFAGAGFELMICGSCATAATVGPMPPVEASHETGYYAPTRGRRDALIEPLRRLAERDRLREFRRLPAGSRVLEVGSGDGRFLGRLRDLGLDSVGIEPSGRARHLAAGSEVLEATAESAQLEPGSFDVAVFWHVLEHLDEPAAALEAAHRWLRPGGTLVIGVPNRLSVQARIGGDRWFHQDVPRHRTHFTPAGVRALLTRTGFEVGRERHLLVDQNPLGMWQTMLNRITGERDVLFRMLKRDPLLPPARRDRALTTLAAPPLAPVAVAVELAAGVLHRGGSIAVVARRLEG